MHQLEEQLQEEAESLGVIDFPEFAAAISNMGVRFSKSKLKRVFAYFLAEQQLEYAQRGVAEEENHKYEVKLKWMVKYLQSKVDNAQYLKPKQIVTLAFMELLEDQSLNQRMSFLDYTPPQMDPVDDTKTKSEDDSGSDGSNDDDKSDGDQCDDGTVKCKEDGDGDDDGFISNDGDFDVEITRHRSGGIEIEHKVGFSPDTKETESGKSNDEKSNLFRIRSMAKWGTDDVNKESEAMHQMMEQMHSQQRTSQISNSGGHQIPFQ